MPEFTQHPAPPVRHDLYVGTLFGIRFYLDYSWFIIAGIVTYTLSSKVFPALVQHQSELIYLAMGVAAALLFFISILLHELGHSLVSQRCGIPVPRITLMLIGGLAEISREPDDPRSELKIAIAGPAVSLFLVGLYQLLATACDWMHASAPAAILAWLATVNLALVIFNAIPGYPLDGGRVLRALIWMRTGKLRRATYITSRIGLGFSWFLIACGVLALFQREWNGFVLLLIGLFLKTAAESGYTNVLYKELLAGVTVRDIMATDPIWVPSTLPLNLAVEDYFLSKHHVAFPVCHDDGEFCGLLRFDFLKKLPRERWPFTSAGDLVHQHDSRKLSVTAGLPANRAMAQLLVPGQGRLAVTDGLRLVGMITRHDILQFIEIHRELQS